MIPHQKQAWFNSLFAAYARRRLRTEFHAVRILGFERALPALRAGPVLAVSNHACWWDPLLLIWLANFYIPACTPCDGYALMDAKNLRRFPFFRKMGVFGVDLDDPADRAEVLAYTQGLLGAPGRLVWIFPQGAERPVTEPLHFHRGAAVVARGAGCAVLPVAIRPEMGRFDRPILWVAFGSPLTPDDGGERDVRAQEVAVAGLLAELEEAVRAASRRNDAGELALAGRTNPLGEIAERALSTLSGRRRRAPR